jgi:hypothetical protein
MGFSKTSHRRKHQTGTSQQMVIKRDQGVFDDIREQTAKSKELAVNRRLKEHVLPQRDRLA